MKSSTREFLEHCCRHKKVEVKVCGKYRKIKVNVNSRYDLTNHLQNNLFYQDCSLGLNYKVPWNYLTKQSNFFQVGIYAFSTSIAQTGKEK